MSANPIVSICCITYNQEKYIRETIDGFLLQKTTFPVEIIINDDFSTDRTADIVREYVNKYPELIRPVFQKENQYSLGRKIFPIVFNLSKGKYIAICEGDDYWTDPMKLQRQVDFLDDNPEYVMVTENAIVDNIKNGTKRKFSEKSDRDIEILELLKGRSFTTASVLFRNLGEAIIPKGEVSGDLILWCHLSTLGKIKYLEKVSSVYRRHHQGVTGGDLIQWSKKMVDWNNTLRQNHPEIDKSVFIQKNLDQFKFPVAALIQKNKYKQALLTIDELIKYTTAEPSDYKQDLYSYVEELLLNQYNSWSFRIGRAVTAPINIILEMKNKTLKQAGKLLQIR